MTSTIIRFHKENEKLLETLRKTAQSNHRSLNSEMMRAVEYYLENAPEAREAKPEKEVKKKSKSPQ